MFNHFYIIYLCLEVQDEVMALDDCGCINFCSCYQLIFLGINDHELEKKTYNYDNCRVDFAYNQSHDV